MLLDHGMWTEPRVEYEHQQKQMSQMAGLYAINSMQYDFANAWSEAMLPVNSYYIGRTCFRNNGMADLVKQSVPPARPGFCTAVCLLVVTVSAWMT